MVGEGHTDSLSASNLRFPSGVAHYRRSGGIRVEQADGDDGMSVLTSSTFLAEWNAVSCHRKERTASSFALKSFKLVPCARETKRSIEVPFHHVHIKELPRSCSMDKSSVNLTIIHGRLDK